MSSRRMLFVVGRSGHVGPRVVRKLIQLSQALDADIELYHSAFEWGVVRKGGVGSILSDIETRIFEDQRRAELDRVAEALRGAGRRATAFVTCEKPGASNIVRHVLETKPDLLVLQSARHGRVARLLLTYTDFKLIETAPCPVLFMKTEKSYCDGCVLAAVDPMHLHDKTAALDESIVDQARMIATGVDASLHLCHAYALPPKPDEALRQLGARVHVDPADIHLELGEPADVIASCAHAVKANIVVMGAVSRSTLERILIGHTAEQVLDSVECDVLVVKPAELMQQAICAPDHQARVTA